MGDKKLSLFRYLDIGEFLINFSIKKYKKSEKKPLDKS
jgi:hypothetical protein